MNNLKREKQLATISHLVVEEASVRSVERLTGVHRDTVLRLLVRVGRNCERIVAERMKGIECTSLELDELWTFCGKKERMLRGPEKQDPRLGDQWVFFAVDHSTKLVPAWAVGKRNVRTALDFLARLRGTLNGGRPQITSDAWPGYADSIERIFGAGADYAQLVKIYESEHPGPGRYAPPRITEAVSTVIQGTPDPQRICASIIERSNLTIRTMQHRFTRLALGFSKKLENLKAAVALHFAYYNSCWVPRTLRVTPAMAAGLTDKVWSPGDLLE